jgi:hypothetical protein
MFGIVFSDGIMVWLYSISNGLEQFNLKGSCLDINGW